MMAKAAKQEQDLKKAKIALEKKAREDAKLQALQKKQEEENSNLFKMVIFILFQKKKSTRRFHIHQGRRG